MLPSTAPGARAALGSRPGPRAFRDCMSLFATGVTVVTFLGPDEMPYGLTANGVASVSLDPPLLLVCVSRTARSHDAAVRADRFSVHVLGDDQAAMAAHFATRRIDKFERVGWSLRDGAPALEEFMARLTCRRWATYPGGDHTIIVGEVVDLETGEDGAGPLVFHCGGYRRLRTS